MKKSIMMSVAAVFAVSPTALAQDAGRSGGVDKPSAGSPGAEAPGKSDAAPSAKGMAPGQMKGDGERAKDLAPGQMKGPKDSARDEAPGQTKRGDKDGANADKSRTEQSTHEKPGADKTKAADEKPSDGKMDKTRDKNLSAIPTEKKSKVRSAFGRHRVEPARNLNISINVGVLIPRTVRLYAVPEDIVVIYPAYQHYRYFLIDDRICIVDPDTFEIVEVIVIA